MVKNYSQQKGSAHIVIIVLLVVALLGALGFVFWQSFMKEKDVNTTETSNSVDTSKDETKPKTDGLTYRNESIGIEFTYPKDWLKVECDNSLDRVYFGTTNEGLAIADGKSTQLCGGGSDFPPQMVFSLRDDITEGLYLDYAESATDVIIDGVRAKKYVGRTDSNSIMPDLESTTYVIQKTKDLYFIASYNRFPKVTTGSRDNSEAGLRAFVDVVEKSLKFL